MSAVFGVTGWKNSGKTTMVAALVKEFARRGFSVSTVKHAHESFTIDKPGTDSHTHREAGAREVAIVSPRRWAIIHEVPVPSAEPSLDAMLKKMAPCDLVIVEGFKSSDIPKLECKRAGGTNSPIWKDNQSIKALATDFKDEDCTLPQFGLNDIAEIADYIAQHTGLDL